MTVDRNWIAILGLSVDVGAEDPEAGVQTPPDTWAWERFEGLEEYRPLLLGAFPLKEMGAAHVLGELADRIRRTEEERDMYRIALDLIATPRNIGGRDVLKDIAREAIDEVARRGQA